LISNAKVNCKRLNTQIEFFNCSASNIPKTFYNQFDFVVSLGNKIVNISSKQLEKLPVKFDRMLKNDGKGLIQILSCDKILKVKERKVNITNKDNKYFLRFYDFGGKDLTETSEKLIKMN
jgi:hypothetical protein